MRLPVHSVLYKILGLYKPHNPSLPQSSINECFIQYEEGSSIAFFDKATLSYQSFCGAGGVIKSINKLVYRWHLNCGGRTNSKAELLGIWATITWANHHATTLQDFGDSKVIIEWLNDG